MSEISMKAPLSPTDPQSRLLSVDAVRGFALIGVLLVNMYNFGAYAPEWTGAVDRAFRTLMHSVFETKSLRLFSLLFGFGFALQLARVTPPTSGPFWFYFRRLLVLFVFGMAHCRWTNSGRVTRIWVLPSISVRRTLLLFRRVSGQTCINLNRVSRSSRCFSWACLLAGPGFFTSFRLISR